MNRNKTIQNGLVLLSPFLLCLCATGEVEKAELPSTDRKYVGTIRNDTVWKDVYVGDRYSQHHGSGVGRNIFLPLIWEDGEPKLKWRRTWRIDAATGRHYKKDNELPP